MQAITINPPIIVKGRGRIVGFFNFCDKISSAFVSGVMHWCDEEEYIKEDGQEVIQDEFKKIY